jgi:hypothetical protein
MVNEFADPNTVVATPEERDYFRLSRYPPPGWYIFVAYYAGTEWASKWNHRSFANFNVPTAIPNKENAQSTVATIGKLIFNVVSGPTGFDMVEYASGFYLKTVWPEDLPSFGAPGIIYDDRETEVLVNCFGGKKLRK